MSPESQWNGRSQDISTVESCPFKSPPREESLQEEALSLSSSSFFATPRGSASPLADSSAAVVPLAMTPSPAVTGVTNTMEESTPPFEQRPDPDNLSASGLKSIRKGIQASRPQIARELPRPLFDSADPLSPADTHCDSLSEEGSSPVQSSRQCPDSPLSMSALGEAFTCPLLSPGPVKLRMAGDPEPCEERPLSSILRKEGTYPRERVGFRFQGPAPNLSTRVLDLPRVVAEHVEMPIPDSPMKTPSSAATAVVDLDSSVTDLLRRRIALEEKYLRSLLESRRSEIAWNTRDVEDGPFLGVGYGWILLWMVLLSIMLIELYSIFSSPDLSPN